MDLLRLPIVGPFLRWRHARTTLQLACLAVAVVVVLHGLLGPDLAPTNLATVVTWVHYRGLLVVALLAAGNFFCTGCPFVRVRDWARRIGAPPLNWPARLRGKWIGLTLFAAVLVSYELFDLWALPAATAWLILGYFAAALLVDVTFRGASFCQHVCPIGQFNFVSATMSPLELRMRDPAVCGACRTADCVSGRKPATGPAATPDQAAPVPVQRGCELGLFMPTKVGNLDCTFCLDCVQACPHDNIALAPRTPGTELVDDRRRSVIGRLVDRTDIAALVVVFVWGAMLNAFAMVAPAHAFEQWLSGALAVPAGAATLLLLFALGLGVVPAVLLTTAAAATRRLVPHASGRVAVVRRFAPALVPVGAGVWAAHYGFHLLTGALVVVPVAQQAAIDGFGRPVLGWPLWHWTGLQPGAVFPIQVGLVVLGTFGSIALAGAIAEREYGARAGRAAAPWTILATLLAGAALWILYQPMQMRGVGP